MYCFDFFAPQKPLVVFNLAADFFGEYLFLPRSVERLCLLFLWIFDLTAYHANELEKLPSSWPDWIPKVCEHDELICDGKCIIGTSRNLLFSKAGILASTLPVFCAFRYEASFKQASTVVPLVLLAVFGLGLLF